MIAIIVPIVSLISNMDKNTRLNIQVKIKDTIEWARDNIIPGDYQDGYIASLKYILEYLKKYE